MLLTCSANPYDFLWNPTTGKTIGLLHFSLTCPTLSDHWVYGLWFDPAGDACKVLRSRSVDRYEYNQQLHVELLSFASDSCKRIPCPYDPCIEPRQDPSLYINGFYYWPTRASSILSFDFAEERFGSLIPEPKSDKFPNARLAEETVYIVEYESSLAAVVFEYGELLKNNKVTSIIPAAERKPFLFEIWVWKEASTWSCVVIGEIPASDAYVHRVLGLYKNCKLLLEGSYGDLLAYDLDTNRLENLGIRDKNMGLMQVFPYVADAESSFKSSSRNLSTCTVDGVPATLGEVTRGLEPNDCLMLMVQCILEGTRICSVISTENNSFKLLREGDDDNGLLPNLSRLKAKNYDPFCMNAKYHVVASCNTWMLWTYTEIPTDPDVLLWDPRTDVLVTLPFFKAEPLMPHPAFAFPWAYSIGFDPCAPGDYKVVRCRVFEDFRSKDEAHADLFSLETWKQIPYPHDLEWQLFQYPSLFIDGFYYWTAKHCTKGDVAIISFDFAKEEFPPALIPMPSSEILGNIPCVCIAEVRGLLAAIVSDFSMNIDGPGQQEKTSAPFIFEIWVWKNGIWSPVSTYKVFPPTTKFVSVIGLYKNDKVLLQDWVGYLWLCDCETLEMEYLGLRDDTLTLKVFPYV